MARPLRIDLAGGFHHVTARGNERRVIFADDRDREHFLELLAAGTKRFGLVIHAWVLMPNHYHLLLETLAGGLSRAMQWINLSYSSWFNRRHRRSGHLFQGRFGSALVEFERWGVEVSRYIHLNPVRTAKWGLDKASRAQAQAGMAPEISPELIRGRVAALRAYRWGSFRCYAGLEKAPSWLTTDAIYTLLGGAWRQRRSNYREFVEEAIREDVLPDPWEELQAGLVLGSREFVEALAERIKGNSREQPQLRQLEKRPTLKRIIAVVEKTTGEAWETLRNKHGDWHRDGVLLLGRDRAGATLRELAEAAGGIDYSTVSVAISRFQNKLKVNRPLREALARLEGQLQDEKM